MTQVAIRAEGLGKRYWIGGSRRADSLRDTVAGAITAPFRRARDLARGQGSSAGTGSEELWALRDLNFEVKRGESLAIIGRNGAGKSTLLKVLSRITDPSAGFVEVTGRVASLLEVGTGFHPDLTGEENIYLNGAILGMTRREVRARFGEIAEFAGVEKFLRTAVKHYSSGMYTRLAFAVAAHLESEILIVDEVLAVGDLEFQRRCVDRMNGVASSGRTVLFVSHNLSLVTSLCERAILLDHGQLVSSGTPHEIAAEYSQGSTSLAQVPIAERLDREGNGEVRITALRVRRDDSSPSDNDEPLYANGPAIFEMHYAAPQTQPLADLHVSLIVITTEGTKLFSLGTRFQNGHYKDLAPRGVVRCAVPSLPLTQGRYAIHVWCAVSGRAADGVQHAVEFDVLPIGMGGTGQVPIGNKHGPILVPHSWQPQVSQA